MREKKTAPETPVTEKFEFGERERITDDALELQLLLLPRWAEVLRQNDCYCQKACSSLTKQMD